MANPCADGESVCNAIYDLSGNADLARYSDVLIGKPLALIGLLILAVILRWALHRLVNRMVRRAMEGRLPDRMQLVGSARRAQRAEAIGSLAKSIITAVIVAVFATMMLSEVGVNIAPIIASAGIIGIALGFGAQSLVRDFLSGVFIILEDQYGVGDVVDVGEASGTIEAVTLRVTRLRDVNGTVWYVPNGEIVRVGNKSQNWARTVLDVAVSYQEDLGRVRLLLQEIAQDLWNDDDFKGRIIEKPEVWGVESLGLDGVTVRVTLKTTPGEQWSIAREMRQRIKSRFDHEGVEMPQRVAWQRFRQADAPTEADS